MNTLRDKAIEILDIIKGIYQIQENNNPNVIFKGKTFLIGTEDDPEAVSIERDYEKKDSTYYFETPEISGAIIKRENGHYCVKAGVKYLNACNQDLWFAKIRIERSHDEEIQIMGTWSGSWQKDDYEDNDFIKKPNSDLPNALDAMKNHLLAIYNHLCDNKQENNNLYDPEWVKKLKKYNN